MFDQLKGNQKVKDIFKRLLAGKRLPNSLMFAGKNGVGKRQFALEVAKAIVCRNPRNGEACDECSACLRAVEINIPEADDNRDDFKRVFFSSHPDVGFVSAYKNAILIDAIRALESEANFRPYEANARFFIINDADKMNDAAANALLKTLEEPSPTSHIFLITSRPDALLPTIRSRCQSLRFAPITDAEIESYLIQTKQLTADDARLIARLSQGSIGRALSFDLERFRNQRSTMMKVVKNLAASDNRVDILRASEEMSDPKNKDYYNDYLEILQCLIHDLWSAQISQNAENIVNIDLQNELKELTRKLEKNQLAAWIKEIEILRENFVVNLNKKIATDALFMKMAG